MRNLLLALTLSACSAAPIDANEPAPIPTRIAQQASGNAQDSGAEPPVTTPTPEHHAASGNPVVFVDAGPCLLPIRERGECDCKHPGAVCADSCHRDETGELVVHAFCVDGGVP